MTPFNKWWNKVGLKLQQELIGLGLDKQSAFKIWKAGYRRGRLSMLLKIDEFY